MEQAIGIYSDDMAHFYENRERIVRNMVKLLRVGDNVKENLLRLNAEVGSSWMLGHYGSIFQFINFSLGIIGILGAFVVAVCLAPLFSGEVGTGMAAFVLSSRHGKNKLIAVKLLVGIGFCIGVTLVWWLVSYLLIMVIYGSGGAGLPYQIASPFSVYPLTFGQVLMVRSLCTLLGSLMTAALTMLLSSKMKAPFAVIIIVSVFLFVPTMIPFSPAFFSTRPIPCATQHGNGQYAFVQSI